VRGFWGTPIITGLVVCALLTRFACLLGNLYPLESKQLQLRNDAVDQRGCSSTFIVTKGWPVFDEVMELGTTGNERRAMDVDDKFCLAHVSQHGVVGITQQKSDLVKAERAGEWLAILSGVLLQCLNKSIAHFENSNFLNWFVICEAHTLTAGERVKPVIRGAADARVPGYEHTSGMGDNLQACTGDGDVGKIIQYPSPVQLLLTQQA
jgi:hypothetical protein